LFCTNKPASDLSLKPDFKIKRDLDYILKNSKPGSGTKLRFSSFFVLATYPVIERKYMYENNPLGLKKDKKTQCFWGAQHKPIARLTLLTEYSLTWSIIWKNKEKANK